MLVGRKFSDMNFLLVCYLVSGGIICVGGGKEEYYEETRPGIGGFGRRFCVEVGKKLVTKNRGRAVGC